MVMVHRQHGFSFVIYSDDHLPAHVHVLGDGESKVVIRGDDGWPFIMSAVGFNTRDRRRAMDVVLERQTELLARWHEIHGGEA